MGSECLIFFSFVRMDTTNVIKKVKQLFGNNHELLSGFNQFLPQGCRACWKNLVFCVFVWKRFWKKTLVESH